VRLKYPEDESLEALVLACKRGKKLMMVKKINGG
jgi:hypothetical protein